MTTLGAMDRSFYTPLSEWPGSIRLLRLLPNTNESAPIRCQLFTYTLSESTEKAHLYEALSYVWGDPNKVLEITVSGHRVNVTENLHAALRRLRDHYLERVIWVDALCIDQGNKEEVKSQILSMARIYGQASRVIVWLGEAADDSDVVLERIRAAGVSGYDACDHDEEAMRRLLERPWFRRVWVLQEVAAARHIRILCGSKDLDGFAFCAGLQKLRYSAESEINLRSSIHPVTHLIRRATFRSPYTSRSLSMASLSIYELGELMDLYHKYEASKRHDKVYALLGMSSDDLQTAGLSPDYDVPWEELLKRLVQHLLGSDVRIYTWHDRDIAMIYGRGVVLGQIVSIKTGTHDAENDYIIILKDKEAHEYEMTLLNSAQLIHKGDILCRLQGASKTTLLRPCRDHFAVIIINAPLVSSLEGKESNVADLQRSLTLIWNWEISLDKLQTGIQHRTIIDILPHNHPEEDLKTSTSKGHRLWDVALVLWQFKRHQEVLELLRGMTNECEAAVVTNHTSMLDFKEKLFVTYFNTEQWEDAESVILQVAQMEQLGHEMDSWNILSRMRPLSHFFSCYQYGESSPTSETSMESLEKE